VTQTSDATTWLTQEAYDRLKDELDFLKGPARHDVVTKIEAARQEGDLKENGGYHAAKEEQGKQEARIRQLSQLLERAQVGEAPPPSGIVSPGMFVTVRFADGEESTFVLGSRELVADDSVDIDVYSPQSPLGSAVNGSSVGSTVEYILPNGRKMSVELIGAKPYTV
jgi:transcription elongation factor GreA